MKSIKNIINALLEKLMIFSIGSMKNWFDLSGLRSTQVIKI